MAFDEGEFVFEKTDLVFTYEGKLTEIWEGDIVELNLFTDVVECNDGCVARWWDGIDVVDVVQSPS